MEAIELKTSAFIVQLLSTFCVCFLACQTGFVCAWPSGTIAMFKSNETVLSAPMTELEVSLLGSLPNVGALVATPFCGYAFNTFGRKYATMLFGLPYVLTWVIISLSNNVTSILIAITIGGIGIAGQNVSLIFITELSHDSIRGSMAACSMTGYIIGLLVTYVFGGYLTYSQGVYTNLALSVLAIFLLMLLRETPAFLVLVGKEEEAAKSISFYNRVDMTSKEVENEVKRIKLQIDPRLEKTLEGQNDPEVTSGLLTTQLGGEMPDKTESAWTILKNSKSSKRALATVLILMALSIMMGSVVVQVYTEPLFREAVPSMPSNLCSILVAVDYLVASFFCVLLIDRCGRKIIMIVTSLGTGIFAFLLGTQLHIHWAPHWVTVALIFGYCFVYNLGCGVIPFVLAAEVFLPEVRSLCNSTVMMSVWIVTYLTSFTFYPLMDRLGLGPVFYLYSAVCFLGALYAYYKLPETRGLPSNAIQSLFLNKSQ